MLTCARISQTVAIHPSSTLHNKKAPAIIYDELVLTTKTYARGVSSVPPKSIRNKVRNNYPAETLDSPYLIFALARSTGTFSLQQRPRGRRCRVACLQTAFSQRPAMKTFERGLDRTGESGGCDARMIGTTKERLGASESDDEQQQQLGAGVMTDWAYLR